MFSAFVRIKVFHQKMEEIQLWRRTNPLWCQHAMKIPQKDSVTLLADHSHDFHEQMKLTATTEGMTAALK